MSTFDYVESAADALELLTEFGGTVEVHLIATGVYDNDTATIGNVTVTNNGTGVVLPFEDGRANHFGSVIEKTDQWLLLATQGLSAAPKPLDRVTSGAETYQFVNVKVLQPDPGAPAVLYDCQVRK